MKKSVLTTIMATVFAFMAMTPAFAGSLDAPVGGDPTVSGGPGAMYTLENIYQRLLNGTTATKRVGPFKEPTLGPAATGHTLDDVYNLIGTRAFVPRTGQTVQYRAEDDGDLKKGVAWPSPRFTDNGDTVTDNLTGLMWIQNPDATTRNWNDAVDYCSGLGTAGHSDWRLPNRFEMESLLDLSKFNPALPAGHPFGAGVQSNWYWTSTTYAVNTDIAFYVSLSGGFVSGNAKTLATYVWPVRGGQ